MRRKLNQLDPVEYRDLRDFVVMGIMPRLRTLAKFVQAGFLEPATFIVRPGVKGAIAACEREKRHRVHLLNAEQLQQSLRARKESPIQ